jgi:cytochrome P450
MFVGGQSVLVLEPPEHLTRRKMLLPPFHGERVQSYARLMERLAAAELDRMRPDEVVKVQPIAQALTLDVILQAVLGGEDVAIRRRLRQLFDALNTPLNSFAMFVPRLAHRASWNLLSRRAWRLKDELDAVLFAHIAATRGDPLLDEREDILAMLVSARDEDGEGLTDEQLGDELITLLAAGHETTATATAWGVELLVHNPTVMARAREGDDFYMDALVKEILRVRSPIRSQARATCSIRSRSDRGRSRRRWRCWWTRTACTTTHARTPSRTPSAPSASWRTRLTATRSCRSAAARTAAAV